MHDTTQRVIKPASAEGLTLDDRHFHLEDVNALTDALIEKSEGRLRELQAAVVTVENRLRAQTSASREKIDTAIRMAQSQIDARLEEARVRAVEMFESSRESGQRSGYEAGYAEGRENGYDEGYRKGYDEAFEKGLTEGRETGRESTEREYRDRFEARTEHAIEALEALAGELPGCWRSAVEFARSDLLTLAMRAAEKIVRHEIAEAPGTVVGALEEALACIESRGPITVEIHPDDGTTIQHYLDRGVDGILANGLEVKPDASISPGGVRVRTQASFVNATVEEQLGSLQRRLEEAGGVA